MANEAQVKSRTLWTQTPAIDPAQQRCRLPALGFGVFQTPPDVTQASVEEALRVGYRMIDTAAAYLNEREVGAAIAASGIDRSELFVQTKVWVSDYGYDAALHAFDVSTRKLGLDQVDLYLLHQPLPQDFDATVDAYRALERLLDEGRVRAIGISNFSPAHLETVLPRLSVVPAVNQVEVHPYHSQPELREVHATPGIATQAWSPLGGVYVYTQGREPKSASPTRSSPTWRRGTGRRPLRSCCDGTSTAGARRSRSRCGPSGSPRTSTCSTSR